MKFRGAVGALLVYDISKHGTFENVERWIKRNTKDLNRISLIGSGGNINKIFKQRTKIFVNSSSGP